MSEFRIGDYNYCFDTTVGLTLSSEDPAFPVENLRNYLLAKVARTSSSGGTFVLTSSNNKIDFKESGGGAELHATIAAGTYSATTLAAAIEAAIEAAGSVGYTVSYSSSTGLWTIATAGAYLSILWLSGVNTATSIGSAIGFDVTADDTGALTYTGASIAIHTEDSLVIDLRTSEDIDSVALIFEKLRQSQFTSEAVVKIQASMTNSWTSPAVDVTLALDTDYGIFTYFWSSAQEYRYWRLKVVDPRNTNLYIEFPKTFLCKATQLTQNPQLGFAMSSKDMSDQQASPYGHRYSDIYPILRTIEFKYAILSSADLATLEQVFERVGRVAPVFFAFDPTATLFDKDRFFIYGYLRDGLGRQHVFNEFFDTGLALEEAQ